MNHIEDRNNDVLASDVSESDVDLLNVNNFGVSDRVFSVIEDWKLVFNSKRIEKTEIEDFFKTCHAEGLSIGDVLLIIARDFKHTDFRTWDKIINYLDDDLSFRALEDFLINKDVLQTLRIRIIKKLKRNIPFVEMEHFFRRKDVDLNASILLPAVHTCLAKNLDYGEVKNFILNEDIAWKLRFMIAGKLKKKLILSNSEILEFVTSNINENVFTVVMENLDIPALGGILVGCQPSEGLKEIVIAGNGDIVAGIEICVNRIFEKIESKLKHYSEEVRKTNAKKLNAQQGIESDKRGLSFYLRYTHTVNHGVILDLVTHVFQKCVEAGIFPIESYIRLIPIHGVETIPEATQNLHNCEALEVQGESFEKALYYGADPIIPSHAARTGREKYGGKALASASSCGDLEKCTKMPLDFESAFEEGRENILPLATTELEKIVMVMVESYQAFGEALVG